MKKISYLALAIALSLAAGSAVAEEMEVVTTNETAENVQETAPEIAASVESDGVIQPNADSAEDTLLKDLKIHVI